MERDIGTTKATQPKVSAKKKAILNFDILKVFPVDDLELIFETMEEGIEDGNKRSLRVRTKPSSSKETLDER